MTMVGIQGLAQVTEVVARWLRQQPGREQHSAFQLSSASVCYRPATGQVEADVQLAARGEVNELEALVVWAEHLDRPVQVTWRRLHDRDYLDARIRVEIPTADRMVAIELWTHLHLPSQFDALSRTTDLPPECPASMTAAELRSAADGGVR